jgi:heptosyltransferase-1
MFTSGKGSARILVVRLGAMGDILHALPAVASLKHSYGGARLTWVVKPQWAPLLEGNPFVDRLVFLRRDFPRGIFNTWRDLRREEYDFAVDFQGLLQSAILASAAHPDRIFGFHQSQLRERAAGVFYSSKTLSPAQHVVDRNLDLAAAAGAASVLHTFPLPPGRPEGQLTEGDFVLASPLAGWRSKQWPMEHYAILAARLRKELGVPLVLNGPPGASFPLVPDAILHCSGLPGLIDATRRAAAVLGVDSGPMHLAAALAKPGVAIFGPTDPARNGPYGATLRVLRSPAAITTYKRGEAIDESMRQIGPDQVFQALKTALGCLRQPA